MSSFRGVAVLSPNEKSGTVSVIDTASDQVIAEIKAGDKLRGLAAGAHKAPLLFFRESVSLLTKATIAYCVIR